MTYFAGNNNGSATSANSSPVVIASDQSVIPVSQGIGSSVTDAGWPFINGELSDTTGTFTNATQTNSITTGASIDGYDTATVTIQGTYGIASGVFEVSDDGGTTWFIVQGSRSDSPIAETGYNSITNIARMWTISVQGCGIFRVRSTAVSSGTANIRISVSSAPTASQTIGQTPILPIDGASAQTATINNIISNPSTSTSIDVSVFNSGCVQVVSTGTGGTYIFEGSMDNISFQTIPVFSGLIATGTPIIAAITATSSSLMYNFPISFKYLRLRIVTTITGGSIQAFSVFKQTAWIPAFFQVAQATAANLATTATIASGTVTTVTTLTGTTTLTPGTGATNLGKARNAAIGATDTGVSPLALRNDTLTTFGTSGSYNTPITDKYGSFIVKQQALQKTTYSLAFTVVPGLTVTDVFQIIGSASKTVMIQKLNISGTQTTGGQITVTISKRSTANTGGTSSASTMVPHDSGDAAATAVGVIYTANPTSTGTPVGSIRIFTLPLGALTSNTNNIVQLDFGERGKSVVLNGVAQALAINLGGITPAGGSLNIWMEFTEE